MNLNALIPNTKSFIYIGLITACALLAGSLQAKAATHGIEVPGEHLASK